MLLVTPFQARGKEVNGLVEIPLTKGHTAVIDAADYRRECRVEFEDGCVWVGRICDRKWKASVKPHTVYATCGFMVLGKQRELRMHRCVVDAKVGEVPDHIDGNGLNNRRLNLRIGSHQQNSRNWHKPNGAVPYRGVGFHKGTGKYEAFIKHDKKKHHLGLFSSPEEAAKARDEAAKKMHGDFARLNFPQQASVA